MNEWLARLFVSLILGFVAALVMGFQDAPSWATSGTSMIITWITFTAVNPDKR